MGRDFWPPAAPKDKSLTVYGLDCLLSAPVHFIRRLLKPFRQQYKGIRVPATNLLPDFFS